MFEWVKKVIGQKAWDGENPCGIAKQLGPYDHVMLKTPSVTTDESLSHGTKPSTMTDEQMVGFDHNKKEEMKLQNVAKKE